MYEDIRRERFLRMQTLTRPVNGNTGASQARTITVVAVILFALSGLITGFAFGAFVHLSPTKPTTPPVSTVPIVQKSGGTTPVATKTVQPAFLAPPGIIQYPTFAEIADSTTDYTLSIQAIDKTSGNAIHASGITCKAWLVKRIPGKAILDLPLPILKNVNTLQNQITGTVQGQQFNEITGLNFDGTTSQTHNCDANGQATWKYQISSTVDPGNYDLVVLTDWNGVHYNWSWVNITIKQAN